MKILFEHSSPLPVQRYGGTERQIFWLMKELVQLGHEVYLIGHPKSQVQSIGVQLISNIINKNHSNEDERVATDWTHLIPKDVDMVHLFYTPHFKVKFPLLITIEGNGQVGETFHPNTVFVSKKHAENHGSPHFVYNGIDLSEYPFIESLKNETVKKSYEKSIPQDWSQFLFLAKAKWSVKNLKHCMSACKAQKKHLHIAGGRTFGLSRYIHSYGMVDQKKKMELFKKTHALLFPVRWHEPFGIAIIEALAMGLPVMGSTYGSLPELIHKDVGILCQNYNEFLNAVSLDKNPFDKKVIRKYVEDHFTSRHSALSYLNYYEKVLSGQMLHSKSELPRTLSSQSAQSLLDF